MKKIFKNAILMIASAQSHSDEGKIIKNQKHAYYASDWYEKDVQPEHQDYLIFKNKKSFYGYEGKDKAIMSVIKIIDSHPYMGINYYIKADRSNDASIVYFNIKIDNKRYQISFHTFSKELKKLNGKGSPCRWEKKIGSRETCQILLKLCGEESKII